MTIVAVVAPLIAAEEMFPLHDRAPVLEQIVAMHGRATELLGLGKILPTEAGPTEAYATVNHGRWCVGCPWCASSQYASRTDHRFFCVECHNGFTNKWAPVIWPGDAADIEAVLARRPINYLGHRPTANWTPGETVEQLRAENLEHQVTTA